MKFLPLILLFSMVAAALLVDASSQGSPSAPDAEKQGGFHGASAPIDDVRFLFKTDVPSHPFDVILGRPTDSSVTASILSYADREGFIDYGFQTGIPIGKTDFLTLKGAQPLEIKITGLKPDTRYY